MLKFYSRGSIIGSLRLKVLNTSFRIRDHNNFSKVSLRPSVVSQFLFTETVILLKLFFFFLFTDIESQQFKMTNNVDFIKRLLYRGD